LPNGGEQAKSFANNNLAKKLTFILSQSSPSPVSPTVDTRS
jgi:hypothetical protein